MHPGVTIQRSLSLVTGGGSLSFSVGHRRSSIRDPNASSTDPDSSELYYLSGSPFRPLSTRRVSPMTDCPVPQPSRTPDSGCVDGGLHEIDRVCGDSAPSLQRNVQSSLSETYLDDGDARGLLLAMQDATMDDLEEDLSVIKAEAEEVLLKPLSHMAMGLGKKRSSANDMQTCVALPTVGPPPLVRCRVGGCREMLSLREVDKCDEHNKRHYSRLERSNPPPGVPTPSEWDVRCRWEGCEVRMKWVPLRRHYFADHLGVRWRCPNAAAGRFCSGSNNCEDRSLWSRWDLLMKHLKRDIDVSSIYMRCHCPVLISTFS